MNIEINNNNNTQKKKERKKERKKKESIFTHLYKQNEMVIIAKNGTYCMKCRNKISYKKQLIHGNNYNM